MDRMAGVATRVAQLGVGPSPERVQGDQDSVDVSPTARALGSGAPPDGGAFSIESAMVDQRVAKYSAVANLRVLSSADEMTRATLALSDRQPRH